MCLQGNQYYLHRKTMTGARYNPSGRGVRDGNKEVNLITEMRYCIFQLSY